MQTPIRWMAPYAFLGLAISCKPSTSVTQTSPIADLESHRVILLRTGALGNASALVSNLEFSASSQIRNKCKFDKVVTPSMPHQKVDVIADLTIQSARRDQEGLIQNPNLAIVDVTMVLSDVAENELLGSAEIRGKSPELYTGGAIPEIQAIDAVSSRLADVLVSSGCDSERVAKPTLSATIKDFPYSPSHNLSDEDIAKAEALNEEGKDAFRGGDILTAKNKFQEAIGIHKTPKVVFNLCLAQEGLHLYSEALTTCQEVLNIAQEERLKEKATLRIDLIKEHL